MSDNQTKTHDRNASTLIQNTVAISCTSFMLFFISLNAILRNYEHTVQDHPPLQTHEINRNLQSFLGNNDAESCADKDFEEVIQITESMRKERGFECFKLYFEALGESLANSSDFNTTSLDGEYSGEMKWFNGPNSLKSIGNRVWKGMICDGVINNRKCTITALINTAPDIGIVTYEDTCPELDEFPCLKIDFTNGPIPRYYYTRQVSMDTFLSFVHTQDGSDTYSDVNVLTLDK